MVSVKFYVFGPNKADILMAKLFFEGHAKINARP